jgi:surfeit locus 1 family protein
VPFDRRLRLAPRLWPTVLTVAAVALFIALGNWQLGRAAEKRALAADFARGGPAGSLAQAGADPPRYLRVTLRGHYDPDHQFLLDNSAHDGEPGVLVLTPFVANDGRAVIVNRGWLPWGADRAVLPAIPVPADERTVSGRLDALPRPGIELVSTPGSGWPKLVNFPHMADLAAQLRRTLHPDQLLLDAGEPDGYLRDWRLPGTTVDRHLGYAVQWFAFAATAIAIWLAVSLRRRGEPA